MHGSLELCWYNERARYLLFVNRGTALETTDAALVENGRRLGADLDFAKPWQHIVWQPDELPTLLREFRAIEARIVECERTGRLMACGPGPAHWAAAE